MAVCPLMLIFKLPAMWGTSVGFSHSWKYLYMSWIEDFCQQIEAEAQRWGVCAYLDVGLLSFGVKGTFWLEMSVTFRSKHYVCSVLGSWKKELAVSILVCLFVLIGKEWLRNSMLRVKINLFNIFQSFHHMINVIKIKFVGGIHCIADMPRQLSNQVLQLK